MKPDARIWAVAGLLTLIGVLLLPQGASLVLASLAALALILLARAPWTRFVYALLALGWMLVITVLLHGFMTPGVILWEIPRLGWNLTREGLIHGAELAGRLGLLAMTGTALSLRMGALEGVRVLESFFRPFARIGLPVGSLILVLGLAMRFIPTLYGEALLIRKSLLTRGWQFGGGWRGRIMSSLPLLLPTLVAGLRRSDAVAETLLLRGFRPGMMRTPPAPVGWGFHEVGLLLLAGAPWAVYFAEKLLAGVGP